MEVQDLILVNAFVTDVLARPHKFPDYESLLTHVQNKCTKLSSLLDNPDCVAIATRVWKFVSSNPKCYTHNSN